MLNSFNPQLKPGVSEIPLTTFGGVVPEMADADLPEGASAGNQDVDFTLGAVFTRDGLVSLFSYDGLFVEDPAGDGVDIPFDAGATWSSPANIMHNTPGTYAKVNLNGAAVAFSTNNPNTGANQQFGVTTLAIAVTVIAPGINVGDTGLVVMEWQTTGTTPVTATSFTDTLGNVYELVGSVDYPGFDFSGHTWTLALFAAPMGTAVAAAGTFTINANFSATCNPQGWFGNMAGVGALLGVSAVTQWAGTVNAAFSAGPITVSQDVILATAATSGSGIATQPFGLGGLFLGNGGAQNVQATASAQTAGTYTASWTQGAGLGYAALVAAFAAESSSAPENSDILEATTYGFDIPSGTNVLGLAVTINGKQSSANVALSIEPIAGGNTYAFQLETADSSVTFGGPGDFLGLAPADYSLAALNNPGFGFDLKAIASGMASESASISGVELKVFLSPNPPQNFNWVKTFAQQDGEFLTLALDAGGIGWQEDVLGAPGELAAFYLNFEPNTFASSDTFEEHEYIALSNLQNGTDMPRQYDGVNVDRISQCGPAAAPIVTGSSTSYAIDTISQPAPVSGLVAILWSTGPGNNRNAGNIITIYYGTGGHGAPVTAPDPNVALGNAVFFHNMASTMSGANPNDTYIINSVGVTAGNDGLLYNTFTVQATTSALQDFYPSPAGSYQITMATLTTAEPIPNVGVGSTISVSGNSVAGYNESWPVAATPNAGTLQISQTSLSGNIATYDWSLVSGTAPAAGEQVTITGCTNGPTVGGLSIFDVGDAIISAASGVSSGSFSIPINGANVAPAPETGAAQINGTIFQFDPGLTFVGEGPTDSPILGTGTGGELVIAGNLGAGLRACVLLFQTRNGFITGPSPYVQFNLTEGASSLNVSQIAIGPPEVIARILCFTGANGSQFYFIPTPLTVTSDDQKITYSATVINDNVTTSATLNFTDAELLSATEIDIPGYNLFNLVELGSCMGIVQYSGRLFAYGEQNKVQNLLNMSFNGGFVSPAGGGPLAPAGWTVDPVNGQGGTLNVSPLYGNSYYIKNATGSTQALYGMLTQSAYQDQYLAGIVIPNFTYGARITARCPSGVTAGSFTVDLYSPSFNRVYGSFSVPLASMTGNMVIFTGDVLTSAFASTVPADLIIREYAAALPDGGDVEMDRVELFPLQQPDLQNQFRASYEEEPEMFDGITGNCGPAQDNKPIRGGIVLFDNLYALKAGGGTYVTSDNDITEPASWKWKTVSRNIGTMGLHSWDFGENWFISGDRQGLYGYGGGPLLKMSQEIQPVWDLMQNRYATVVRCDLNNRRILVFCCIPTGPATKSFAYMPEMPANANPTSPNVCLAMNWRELDSIEALVGSKPLHQGYTGLIKAFDFSRKWSYWNVTAPYADFCERADGTATLLVCNGAGNSKIYDFDSEALSDDGAPINSWYKTYGFVRPDTQQGNGLGLGEMELTYSKLLVAGAGELMIADYPSISADTIDTQYYAPITLQENPVLGEIECPMNDYGTRFFVRVGTNAVGSYFRLSKMVLTLGVAPWAPTKGASDGSN